MPVTSSSRWESDQTAGVFALHDASVKAMSSSVSSLRLAFEKLRAVQEASKGRAGEDMAQAVEACIKILSRAARIPCPTEDILDMHEASIQAVEEALPSLKRALTLTLTLQAAASGFRPSKAHTLVPRLRIPGMVKVVGTAINHISMNVRMARIVSSVGRHVISDLLSEPFGEEIAPVPLKVKSEQHKAAVLGPSRV